MGNEAVLLSSPSSENSQDLSATELYNSGLDYAKNDTVEDLMLAFSLFNQAANMGSESAQYKVACCYRDGKGIEKNPQQAFKLFTALSKQNPKHHPSQFAVACCYLHGKGTQKSEALALRKLKILDENDYTPAQWQLADYFGKDGNKTKAAWYYSKIINKKTELTEEEIKLFNHNKDKITITPTDLESSRNSALLPHQIEKIIDAVKKAKIEGVDEIFMGLVKASKGNLWPNELAEIYQKFDSEQHRDDIITLMTKKIKCCIIGDLGQYPQVAISTNDDKTFNVEMLDKPPLLDHLKRLIWTMPKNLVGDRLNSIHGIHVFPYDDQKEERIFKIFVEGISNPNSLLSFVKDKNPTSLVDQNYQQDSPTNYLDSPSPATSIKIRESTESLTDREKSRVNYMTYKHY